MKHRRNKVKREHGIIQGALNWLVALSQHPQVTDIIPGVIQISHSPERGVVYKYPTQTGCKILLKSNGSIQEAFVVTKDPEFVRRWVKEHFPEQDSLPRPLPLSPQREVVPDNKYSPSTTKAPPKRGRESGKGARFAKECFGGSLKKKYMATDSPWSNLGEIIGSESRQALTSLQKELKPSRKRSKDNFEDWFLGGE